MGLDILAYSQLKAVGKHTEGWCDDEDHVNAFAYDTFPKSFAGIPILSTSKVGGSGFIEGGCYAITDATETIDFQAGSYIGYGNWRADLARQFNPDTSEDEPFYELIWFADNEGCIGELAAANLLADFRAHAAGYAPEPASHSDYALAKYRNWTRACELAADGGLIRFR